MQEKLLKFAQAYFLDNSNGHFLTVAIVFPLGLLFCLLPLGLLFCLLECLFLKFVSIFKRK